MTASELQRDLEKKIEELVKDVQSKTTTGRLVSGVTVYEQKLPELTAEEDEPSQFFPYAIIRLESGSTPDDEDAWNVSTSILFGIHDGSPNSKGHRTIMEMIQRTVDYFTAYPLLNHKFRAQQDISWALPDADADTYPFYFGGVEIKFSVPKMARKDIYT